MPIITGRDCIAQAQSGTGKTATFSVSILQRVSHIFQPLSPPSLSSYSIIPHHLHHTPSLQTHTPPYFDILHHTPHTLSYPHTNSQIDTTQKKTQALILAPTRELAQQIQKVVIALGDYLNVDCHACVGGTLVREDMAKLAEGPHVVVGTPGRVFDMINRGALKTEGVKMFCLDEADEMLSTGFKDSIYDIFQLLPADTQVVLLSATMPSEVLEVTKKFMRDPIRILVKRDELTLEGIRQFCKSPLCHSVQCLCQSSPLRRRTGSSRPFVICTRPSPSPRPSSSALPEGRSTGSPPSFTSESSLSLPCTERWTRVSERSS